MRLTTRAYVLAGIVGFFVGAVVLNNFYWYGVN